MSDAVFWAEVERFVEDGETVVVAEGRNPRGPEALPGGTEEGLRLSCGHPTSCEGLAGESGDQPGCGWCADIADMGVLRGRT